MTKNKQITIYELLPLLKPGWVAMDDDGTWSWFEIKPRQRMTLWQPRYSSTNRRLLGICFNIAPFDGDWKDSLIEVK